MATLDPTLVCLAVTRMRIVTAYFSPDDTLVDSLLDAANRGVKIELMVPGKHCDSRLSQYAGYKYIEPLLEAGVTIWRYEKTMLHSKLMTVDDEIACIGSANLNHRSMIKDEECCVVALSPSIVDALNEQFEKDVLDSEQYTIEGWSRRGLLHRLGEKLARVIVKQV